MREVKFRGKVDGKWWHATFNDSNEGEWEQFWALVSRKTVGQWTGALDKIGKEIYEGDILSAREFWGEAEFGVVAWNEKQLQWYLTREDISHGPLRTPFTDGHMPYEVIGTIHDDMDLIYGKS